MRVYRIARADRAEDLSGEGARLYGGRWNPPGRPLLYTANTSALAALEVLVNFDWDLKVTLSLIEIEMPDAPQHISKTSLPEDWPRPGHPQLRKIGEEWLVAASGLSLAVPSATMPLAPDAFNILINPQHPDFSQVSIRQVFPFSFDARLQGS